MKIKTKIIYAFLFIAVSGVAAYPRALSLENKTHQLDVIDAETMYFMNNFNAIRFPVGDTDGIGEGGGHAQCDMAWRRGMFNQDYFVGGSNGVFSMIYGFTLVNQRKDESYNPYGNQKATAARNALAAGLETPYGSIRACGYMSHRTVNSNYDPYQKYKGKETKEWDPHFMITATGGLKDVFDGTFALGDLFKKAEIGVPWLSYFRTAPVVAQKKSEGNSVTTTQLGMSQDLYLSKEPSSDGGRYISGLFNYKFKGGKNDGVTYRAEAYGVIPYIYAGCWYNKKYGSGFGGGIGVWPDKRSSDIKIDASLIAKWNEIVPDPVFGRTEGLTVQLTLRSSI